MSKIIPTKIADVFLIEPNIFKDSRGLFFESFNQLELSRQIAREIHFIQDNHSLSFRNVIRGLHYQKDRPQAKLISVTKGEIFDVAVDIRPKSHSFGQWVGHILSAENKLQMFIPEGFAHGFLTLSENSQVHYKVNAPYVPEDERSIIWNDKILNIAWPLTEAPILSDKDKQAKLFC